MSGVGEFFGDGNLFLHADCKIDRLMKEENVGKGKNRIENDKMEERGEFREGKYTGVHATAEGTGR